MSVSIRQGLEDRDAVLSVYDPCPVVLYDSTISSLYNYRYVLKITRVTTGVEVATIKRFPNSQSCGTFDISQILKLAVSVGDPSSTAINVATNPCSSTNNTDYFKIEVGSESSTTENGAVSVTYDLTRYVHAFAGRFCDQFISWSDNVLQNYVMNPSIGGRWLTLRPTTENFYALGTTHAECYVVPIQKDRKFSMSYLSTDLGAGYDTDAMSLKLSVGTKTTQHVVASVTITNQNVSITAQHVPDANGGLIRDVHIGPVDLEGFTWASALQAFKQWTYMRAEFVKQSDGTPLSLPIIFEEIPFCNDEGLIFKYLNNLGGYEYLWCRGYTQQTTEYTRETYNTSSGNWHTATGLSATTDLLLNDPAKRQIKSEVTSERKTFRTNTGYLESKDNALVHGLLASKRVYCNKFVGNRERYSNTFYPVNITNTSMRAMFQEVDKLIDYTIEFQYANLIRPSV